MKSAKEVKNHLIDQKKVESRESLKQVDVYETFAGGKNSSLSKLSPKSEEENFQYMELAVKYQDMNPVYTKLSQ